MLKENRTAAHPNTLKEENTRIHREAGVFFFPSNVFFSPSIKHEIFIVKTEWQVLKRPKCGT